MIERRPIDPLGRVTMVVAYIVLALGFAVLGTLFIRPARPLPPAPKFTLRIDAGAVTAAAPAMGSGR